VPPAHTVKRWIAKQGYLLPAALAHREHNTGRGIAQWLDPDAPMLARMLQQSGYATDHFGKWHMGGQRDVGEEFTKP